MLTFVLSVLAGLVVLILFAVFINKIPKKAHPIFILILLGLSGFFGYKLYQSIAEPVEFEKVKEERYKKVISKLIKLREAQTAHKLITGKYAENIKNLTQFVDTAQFALTTKRDSTVVDRERNIKFRLDPETGGYTKEVTIIDTLGFKSVKDSLFKNTDVAKLLDYGIENAPGKIKLETGLVPDKDQMIPVFKATADKKEILFDQPEKLVKAELEVKAVEAVNGSTIYVGSLDEITTSGNWPRKYADN
ncbi:hypothetical protein [Nonlabens tegetincola]|uniref:hypothetical protein n=1 Tax=Nonlabens tegetincola TaxID=323273 RepID=UPI001F3097D9|nr:hypothetical protein [Nonlabens tegetincola]